MERIKVITANMMLIDLIINKMSWSKSTLSAQGGRNPSKQSHQHCCKWRHKKEAVLQKMDRDLLERTRRVLSFVFLFVSISPLCLCICCQKLQKTGWDLLERYPFWPEHWVCICLCFNSWKLLRDRQDDCTLEGTDLLSLDILFYFTSAFDWSWRVGIFWERQYWFKKQHKKAMYHTKYRRKLKR